MEIRYINTADNRNEIRKIYKESWKHAYRGIVPQEFLDELEKQGFKEVFLWTLECNSFARRFYERNGFSYTGEYLNDNIGGKELREVRYVYHF